MSIDLILYIAAIILFLLAAFGVQSKVNLVALGLALFVLTFVV